MKVFLSQLIKSEGKKVEAINYIFSSDDYLLKLNQQYLSHNTYTDIITFEQSAKGQPLLSDIFISVDRVKENAAAFKSSFNRELHRVVFHGALHLCGYGDKTAKNAQLMRKMEDKWIDKYFVS